MNHQAFVICLERATERLAHARATLTQLPLPAEILPAIDGRAMTRDAIETVYRRGLHRPHYPFELDTGNIGCFLSHRAAWQQIVERNLDAALVLEDDAHVDQALNYCEATNQLTVDMAMAWLFDHPMVPPPCENNPSAT